MREIRAVLFDLFGTLVLYPADTGERFARSATTLGLAISGAGFDRALVALKERVSQRIAADQEFARRAAEGRQGYWVDWYTELLSLVGVEGNASDLAVHLFEDFILGEGFARDPEATSVLTVLRERFKVGVITNASLNARVVLDREELTPLLDVVVISAEVGVEKPDAVIFMIALDQLNVLPAEALFVGDSLAADVQGAQNAGLTPIFFDRKNQNPQISCRSIHSLAELLHLPQLR